MAFHYSRRKLKVREEEEAGELNIVPYLDILMNLIIFMLLSITGLASFGILNVSAPAYGTPSAGMAQETPDEGPKLTLSVLISKKGLFVSSEDAVVGQDGAPSVPVKADGSYDFAALNAMMAQLKDRFPKETKAIVAADPDIPYEALIQTMDALREEQGPRRRLLFPDVTLGAI
jgi:biopolymer transport protein ExbD